MKDEILKAKAKKLGFDDPDDCIRANWSKIPSWLQHDLIKSGFIINSNL